MNLLDNLDKREIREFFSKGWLTHDAMWFYHCLQECGPEKTNKINKAAIRSMAAVEIHRILKLMGKQNDTIKTFDELKEIIDSTYKLVQADFMKLYYSFPEKNLFRGGFHECFAHQGVTKFGMADTYECGIIIRVQGWFEALGVTYQMTPEFSGCLMRDRKKCEIEFRFNLD